MSEWLPEPYERVFAAASDGYEARRRKKERKRIEKKMKMMKESGRYGKTAFRRSFRYSHASAGASRNRMVMHHRPASPTSA